MLSVLALSLAGAAAGAQTPARWTRIGPEGGVVAALAAAPSRPTTVYTGLTFGGGVYRSIDGGASWTFAGAGLGRQARVTGISVDAARTGTVYAATGAGLFRTEDGGASWLYLELPTQIGTEGSVVTADPRRSGIVYVTPADGGQLLASSNRGRTWRVLDVPAEEAPFSLAIDPESPDTLYAGTFISGVFKSTDAGAHWKVVTGGLRPAVSRVSAVAVDPRRPQTVFFSTPGGGVYRSTDGGGHWTKTSTGLPAAADIQALAIDPYNSSVFAGSAHNGVFRSSDGGLHWRPADAGLSDRSINALIAAAGAVFAGSPSGLVVSRDRAATWQSAHGIRGLSITSLAIDAQEPPRLYAFGGNRLYTSESPGAGWTRLPLPDIDGQGPVGPVAVHPDDPRHVELGYVGLIAHSHDGGHTWSGHFDVPCIFFPTQILIDPSADIVYAPGIGSYPICGPNPHCFSYKFDPSGSGQVSCVTNPPVDPEGVDVRALDPADPSHLFGGLNGLYQSLDAGATWSLLSIRIDPAAVLVDPVQSERLYVAVPSLTYGVLRSVDGGVTWQTSTGLPTNTYVLSLAIDPGHPSTLYAATSFAVYRSTDSGATWKPLGTGLEDVGVGQIALDPRDPRILYAATSGGGVMRVRM
jgi:photosystem II stability/assembly factor-like uncharacterized protein